jgi:hypothetical protein
LAPVKVEEECRDYVQAAVVEAGVLVEALQL